MERDYLKLKSIPLEEVKEFFPKKAYLELVNLGFNNIGDLLEQDINGELAKMFYRKHPGSYELWENIHGSISFLKYKYLGIAFNFDVKDNDAFSRRSGFIRSVRKRFGTYRFFNINELIKMVEFDDYSELYKHFNEEIISEIVNKVRVISDYLKSKSEVSVDDIKTLYNRLAELTQKYNEVVGEIEKTKLQIEEKTMNKSRAGK